MAVGGLEAAFREEWPRILGSVLRFTGDLQLAEDAVQEACARLLARSASGAQEPANVASYLTTAAKHIAVDTLRRDAGFARSFGKLAADAADRQAAEAEAQQLDPLAVSLDDDRLRLIVLACHPELAEEARLALALRVVCGVPTDEIADLFLVKRATMAARLTRAKQRIQASGIRLEAPDARELAARLDDVLSVVYLLYTLGHTAPSGHELSSAVVSASALGLARETVRIAPRHLEARGLLALILLTEARSPGRTAADGTVVGLEHADRSRWDRELIEEGIDQATVALAGRGRFALQAGIAGLHSEAPDWAATDWVSIVSLYDALARIWPSPAVLLNRSIARSHLPGALETALAEIDALEPLAGGALARQRWAARGELLHRAGRHAESAAAYRTAIEAEPNRMVRAFLAESARRGR